MKEPRRNTMNRITLIIVLLIGGQAMAQHGLELDFNTISTRGLERMLNQVKQGVVDENVLAAIEEHLEQLIKARNGRKPVRRQPDRLAIRAAVEAFLEQSVNDPSRLKIARIGKPVSTAGAYKWMGHWTYDLEKHAGLVGKSLWEPIGHRGFAVAVRYRATNALGALVLDDKVFCISGGAVFDWMEVNDFHPTRPKRRSDPMTDAFMKLAR